MLAPALHRAPHSLLRASLDTGRIGSARFLRCTRWAPAGPGELAGALIDELAAVLDLMGRPAVTAYAAGQAVGADGPDYVTAILTFERGLTAVLDVGSAPSGGQPFDRAMLIGAHGSIHADGRAAAPLRLDDSESTPIDLDGPFAGHIRAVEAFTGGESLDLDQARRPPPCRTPCWPRWTPAGPRPWWRYGLIRTDGATSASKPIDEYCNQGAGHAKAKAGDPANKTCFELVQFGFELGRSGFVARCGSLVSTWLRRRS